MLGATREFLETYSDGRRKRFSKSQRRRCSSFGSALHHFYVDGNAGREIEVREGLNNLRRGVKDIYESLMDAHFKLFSSVFVDEGRTVDCPALDLGGERDRADHDSVKARGSVHNLLHREI